MDLRQHAPRAGTSESTKHKEICGNSFNTHVTKQLSLNLVAFAS